MKLKQIFLEYMDEKQLTKLSDAQVANDYFKTVNGVKNNSLTYSDEQKELIRKCVGQSSEVNKTILKMHYWENITLNEIATILGLRLSIVKKMHETAVQEVRIKYFSQNILYKKKNQSISKIIDLAIAV